MDKPAEKALNPAHERKKGEARDHKECGDTDVGIQKYGPGNVRAQLDGLWSIVPKEVVGLGPDRILTNRYCKTIEKGEGSAKEEAEDLMDEILNGGPPLLNTSKPKRVF